MSAQGLKACRTCKTTFPATNDNFYNLESSPDKLHPDCKQCCKVSRSLEAVRKRDKRVKISIRQRVRAMNLGITYEDVKLSVVFRMSRGICKLCGEWVMPKHASMDHILPLSRGGTHHYHNVQLTHFLCNQKKSNKVE